MSSKTKIPSIEELREKYKDVMEDKAVTTMTYWYMTGGDITSASITDDEDGEMDDTDRSRANFQYIIDAINELDQEDINRYKAILNGTIKKKRSRRKIAKYKA